MNLASSRPEPRQSYGGPEGPMGPGMRGAPQVSPHMMHRRPSMSSRASPPVGSKRPLSPAPEDNNEFKRSRVGSISHRVSPQSSGGRPTPTRRSPVQFHQQPTTSRSPETRQPMDTASYPPSPSLSSLPIMLPPHPRPVGAGMAGHGQLPPLSHSSPSNGPSSSAMDDERMHSRSTSPLRKREIVLHQAGPGSGSPPIVKGTPSPSSSHGSHASNGRSGPIP